jgi:hypothetical protein
MASLPSLVRGEWSGKCDLCCDGRSLQPALAGAAQLLILAILAVAAAASDSHHCNHMAAAGSLIP